VRTGTIENYDWFTAYVGFEYNLPESVIEQYGFEKIQATEGNIGETKVETKQVELIQKSNQDGRFLKELIKIKGIGKEYANDIIIAFPNEECMRKAIKENKDLQFRKDVNKILREVYG